MNSTKLSRLLNFWRADKNNISLISEICSLCCQLGDEQTFNQFQSDLNKQIAMSPGITYVLAWSHIKLNQIDQAKTLFESLPVEEDGKRIHGIATAQYLSSQFEQSLASIESHSKDDLISPNLSVLAARCQYQLGQLESARDRLLAVKTLDQALESERLGLLAMLSFDLQIVDQASVFAKQALQISEHNHDALLAAASVETYQTQFSAALSLIQKGTQLFPGSGRFWLLDAQIQLLQSDIDSAYASAIKAATIMPEHIGSWHLKAWVELLKHDYAEAHASFETATELNRNFADSHAGKGITAFYLGQREAAEKHVKVALKLDPQCVTGLYATSLFAGDDGDVSNSKKIVESILNQPSHLASDISYLKILERLKK